MPTIEIEYCVPCGLLGKAQAAQEDVLEAFGQDVDGVTLVPGDGGILEIRLGDEVLLDGDEEGYDADVVLERIRERVGAPAGAGRESVEGPTDETAGRDSVKPRAAKRDALQGGKAPVYPTPFGVGRARRPRPLGRRRGRVRAVARTAVGIGDASPCP